MQGWNGGIPRGNGTSREERAPSAEKLHSDERRRVKAVRTKDGREKRASRRPRRKLGQFELSAIGAAK